MHLIFAVVRAIAVCKWPFALRVKFSLCVPLDGKLLTPPVELHQDSDDNGCKDRATDHSLTQSKSRSNKITRATT
jgi:hypothetical protein